MQSSSSVWCWVIMLVLCIRLFSIPCSNDCFVFLYGLIATETAMVWSDCCRKKGRKGLSGRGRSLGRKTRCHVAFPLEHVIGCFILLS